MHCAEWGGYRLVEKHRRGRGNYKSSEHAGAMLWALQRRSEGRENPFTGISVLTVCWAVIGLGPAPDTFARAHSRQIFDACISSRLAGH